MKRAVAQFVKRTLKLSLLLLLLLAAGGIIFLSVFDLNDYRAEVQETLSDNLHRKVEIIGDMSLGISFKPTIVVNNVRIHNPDWASRPYFASLDKIHLEFELLPLFDGIYNFTELEINGADIQLETNADGLNNWQFRTGESSRAGMVLPGIEELDIYNSTISRITHGKPIKTFNIKEASLSAALDEDFEIEIDALYQNTPVELSISTAIIDLDKDKWPVEIDLDISGNELSFDGFLHKDVATDGLAGTLTLSGKNINKVTSLFGIQLPDVGKYELTTDISLNTRQLKADYVDLDVEFNFNKQHLSIADGKFIFGKTVPLDVSFAGVYADKPYELSFSAGTYNSMGDPGKSWPVHGSVQSADNSLKLDGTLSDFLHSNKLDLDLLAGGDDITVYEPLFGVKMPRLGDYSLQARITGQNNKYRSSIRKAMISGTDVKGNIQYDFSTSRPKIAATLTADHVQPGKYLQDKPNKKSGARNWLDKPIDLRIPKSIDADFNIKVGKISGLPLAVENINIQGRLDNGRLSLSPVNWRMSGGKFLAKAHISQQDNKPSFDLNISARDIDAMKFSKALGYDVGSKSTIEDVNIKSVGTGDSVRNLLTSADIMLTASRVKMVSTDKKQARTVFLDRLGVNASKNRPLSFAAHGDINGVPLSLTFDADTLINRLDNIKPLPVNLTASLFDAKLNVNGTILDIAKTQGIDLQISMKGRRLDKLEPLIATKVLQVSPYEISSHFSDNNNVYTFEDIAAKIGKSDFSGYISISHTDNRAYVQTKLQSKDLHYYDFVKEARSSKDKANDERVIPDSEIPVELLRALDVELDIHSERFFVGDVEYNNTTLHSVLDNGVLTIDPLISRLVGGDLIINLEVDASNDIPLVFFDLDGRDIDYGELIETLGLTDKMNGKGDVFVSLDGEGEDIRALFATANGTAHIISEEATINEPRLELWAADLVTTALSSAWEVERVTNVNCIVGRTDVIDGVAKTDSLLLDTDRITIAGSGGINLATEEWNILITPAPKNPSFVSIATPVRLTGTMANPQVSKEKTSRSWLLGGVLAGLANPGTLLFMYGNLGTGEKNPCLAAVKQRELTEQQAIKEGEPAPKRLPGRILDFLLRPVDKLTAPDDEN